MTAEITLARPRIWTQIQRDPRANGLDPQALFFDSESRGVAASADGQDNAQNASALAMMQAMMQQINHLQTTSVPKGPDHDLNSFSGAGSGTVAQGKTSHVPPAVPPSLFTLPKVRAHFLTPNL